MERQHESYDNRQEHFQAPSYTAHHRAPIPRLPKGATTITKPRKHRYAPVAVPNAMGVIQEKRKTGGQTDGDQAMYATPR
ncbi:hypothetical protein [Leptothoe kymatousa]|uniref:Uncharacterized protein n=1 Tax=Leptothoe kymatousa TAU-MAC 1615 TaxID=2364775 RepID=A0ABS5Y5E7_9CYAN|nr:hypothetical protein [Leptothoe kymatousa]MBT9312205.1 hypothetical protein [Leptothoe kymatousa TAU-MAC 1615]